MCGKFGTYFEMNLMLLRLISWLACGAFWMVLVSCPIFDIHSLFFIQYLEIEYESVDAWLVGHLLIAWLFRWCCPVVVQYTRSQTKINFILKHNKTNHIHSIYVFVHKISISGSVAGYFIASLPAEFLVSTRNSQIENILRVAPWIRSSVCNVWHVTQN